MPRSALGDGQQTPHEHGSHLTWHPWFCQPGPEASSQVLLWAGGLSEGQPSLPLMCDLVSLPLPSELFLASRTLLSLPLLFSLLASPWFAGSSPDLPSCGWSQTFFCLCKELAHRSTSVWYLPGSPQHLSVALWPLSCQAVLSM